MFCFVGWNTQLYTLHTNEIYLSKIYKKKKIIPEKKSPDAVIAQ